MLTRNILKTAILVALLASASFIGGCSKLNYEKEQNRFVEVLKQGDIKWKNNKDSTNITFKDLGASIVIPLKINGSNKTRYFVVDTGAPTIIDISLAKELALSKIRDVITEDSSNSKKSTPLVKLKSITIGDVSIKNINVIASNLKSGFGNKIDGILGSNILMHFGVLINYKKHKFSLSRSVDRWISNKDRAIEFKQHIQAGLGPIIKCQIANLTLPALIDTGASTFDIPFDVFKETTSYKNHQYVQSIGQTSMGLHQIDNNISSYFGLVDKIILGDSIIVNNIPVYASKLNRFALIGKTFLYNYEIVINYPNHKLYLKPLYKKIKKDISSFGVGIIKKGDELIVISLWRGSSAYNKGLRIGDRILSINGRSSKNISQSDIFSMFDIWSPYKTIDIIFKNSKGKHHLKLLKKPLKNL